MRLNDALSSVVNQFEQLEKTQPNNSKEAKHALTDLKTLCN